MTGEKNRYSSVEKLWKLDDETLKTPRHDEMVIWLLNKTNIKKILPPLHENFDETLDKYIRIESEVPITTHNKFIVGYWDIVVSVRTKDNLLSAYIEVKPTVVSFGATLRQIKTYQQYIYMSVGNTYLFTDNMRFKDAFESQGIKVISAEEMYKQGGK